MKTLYRIKSFPISSLLSVSVIWLMTFAVQAADVPVRGPIPFAIYDQDGDGAVSQEEFNSTRNVRIQNNAAAGAPMKGLANAPTFNEMDLNADGQLSLEELSGAQSMQRNQKQSNGTGKNAMMGKGRNMPSFEEIDLDGDGYISETEMNAFRSARINQRATEGYPMRNIGNMQSFSEMDLNHDGMMDSAEFNQHQMKQKSP